MKIKFPLVLLILTIITAGCAAQSRTNRVYRPCPSSTTPAVVDVQTDGDIQLTPCIGHSIWAGSTNLTIFNGGLSGLTSGTVPFWTGDRFQDTNIIYNSFIGTVTVRGNSPAGMEVGTNTSVMGDLINFDTNVYIDSQTGQAQLYGAQTSVGAANSEIRIESATDTLATRTGTWDLSDANGAGWGVSTFKFLRTITAGGTTGSQTINKPAGTVNIAAGAGTVTVTNSIAAATSIVFAIPRTNDATCSVKNVVPAAGSFVINMTANCTGETSVGFLVTN